MKSSKNFNIKYKELNNILFNQGRDITEFSISFSKLLKAKSFTRSKLFVLGNGGLYSEADHFCAELTCTFKKNSRKPYDAFNLAPNPSALTAWSNDFNFNTLYKRLVRTHCSKNDILYIMSSSGGYGKTNFNNNLFLAALEAKKIGTKVISVIGEFPNKIQNISSLTMSVKSKKTSTIQEVILFINHLICEELE